MSSVKTPRSYRSVPADTDRWSEEIAALSDAALRERAQTLREAAQNGTPLVELRGEGFALVREAAHRTIGLRHFDCQLIGGAILADGKIAEMGTGEGKTLTATLAVTLLAWQGHGVHVVTVNEYLAARDQAWMAPVYSALGLSSAVLRAESSYENPQDAVRAKQTAYRADITYGTNSEFAFDYLRDHLAKTPEERVMDGRAPAVALVDEVDNILIDEARTPLIISGPVEHAPELYLTFTQLAASMERGDPDASKKNTAVQNLARTRKQEEHAFDYSIDEKNKLASVTERGVAKAEAALGLGHLYLAEHGHLVNCLHQALCAKELYARDRDYVVVDDTVLIVDEHTGRVMPGREWTDGLHQAIESKEGVPPTPERQTLASVSYQNFFRRYEVLAGMTGTAMTEAREFKDVYKLEVIVVPPNRPTVREDRSDRFYATHEQKFAAAVKEIERVHATGQPLLVGSASVEASEELSDLLTAAHIPHQVLNAKPELAAQEAALVAQAGRSGRVTLATNMAGRGTDIRLGGDPLQLAREQAEDENRGASEEVLQTATDALLPVWEERCDEDRQRVVELGGLFVLGTERHDSRRIDDQLRGRAGRQGEPGVSMFLTCGDDRLVRIFASGRMGKLLTSAAGSGALDFSALTKQVKKAQLTVEETHFRDRKRTVDYDDVVQRQREVVYGWRDSILDEANLGDRISNGVDEYLDGLVTEYLPADASPDNPDTQTALADLNALAEELFAVEGPVVTDAIWDSADVGQEARLQLQAARLAADVRRLETLPDEDALRVLERHVLLVVLDERWAEHLADLEYLRNGIILRQHAQLDPLVAYKNEAFDLFADMMQQLWAGYLNMLHHAQVNFAPAEETDSDASGSDD